MSEPSTRFLNPEQAARYLGGLNARTVTRWAREGYLPAFPIGEGKRRLWRFRETDLEAWMVGRRQGRPVPSCNPYPAILSGPHEWPKQILPDFARNARPVIGDTHKDILLVIMLCNDHFAMARRGGGLAGIKDQIEDRTAESPAIAPAEASD